MPDPEIRSHKPEVRLSPRREPFFPKICRESKFKITLFCELAGQVEITDSKKLSNEWDQRSADQLASDLARFGPLKVELLNLVWSSQPFDPRLISQAWIHGLTEGESFGTGTQDLGQGELEYHGNVSTGWEHAKVDILQLSANSPAVMTFTAYRQKLNC